MKQDLDRPGADLSPFAQQLDEPFAALQEAIRAFSAASENLGATVRLRAEVVVVSELVEHIGLTLGSLAEAADEAPDFQIAPGLVDSSALAQGLRAIRDLRELRALSQKERKARELAEAQQVRAVEDFRTSYRRATALAKLLEAAYLETITALANAVEARDHVTGDHVERVRSMSIRIGQILNLNADTLRQLQFGAVLHDVGKIGSPDAILGKAGPLTPSEFATMREHPVIGRRILEGVSFLAPALPAVEAHHERWDGTGYPHGLAGDAIPLAGRIVAVVDAFDAMTSDRPYRAALPVETALARLIEGRGTQFDPSVVDAFFRVQESSDAIKPES
ncbi:MAG TPA: HD domain-containing phosphohydrolase [Chloroflexota bacterium]|nr:HD domain-containing phosphohydrolase [Chloroflexota bacterium]